MLHVVRETEDHAGNLCKLGGDNTQILISRSEP